jgi:hypothetical protein
MRVTEERPPRVTLDIRRLRCFAPPPAAPDDAPFGVIVGALVGVLISVPLWVLIAVAVVLLRRG